MAPGRQADALAFVKEISRRFENVTGVKMLSRVVTTKILGIICISTDYENIKVYEADFARFWENTEANALRERYGKELRDGTSPWIPGAEHEEFWRDAWSAHPLTPTARFILVLAGRFCFRALSCECG